jgi:hypothetical protein
MQTWPTTRGDCKRAGVYCHFAVAESQDESTEAGKGGSHSFTALLQGLENATGRYDAGEYYVVNWGKDGVTLQQNSARR